MSLCLISGSLFAALPLTAFTLAWTHSIEKTRWEEDWHISGPALVASEARIRGSGAGMEPPPGAELRNGTWHYVPAIPPQKMLRLANSAYAASYELCFDGTCHVLADLLPGIEDNAERDAMITLAPCTNP